MRDPLGFDPIGLDGIQVVQRQAVSQVFQQALRAYFVADMVLPGVHLVDHDKPVGPPVGDDGQVLTLERRQEIAASRPALNLDDPNLDYRYVGNVTPETMGATAEKALRKSIIVARAKVLELPAPEGDIVHGDSHA